MTATPALRAVPVAPQESTCAPDAKPIPTLCLIGGSVDESGAIALRMDQTPGALTGMLGDRADVPTLGIGETAPAPPFSHCALEDLLTISLGSQKLKAGPLPAERANAMLQAVAAFEPANELEGMIAQQAVALHHATMDCMRRAMRTDRLEHRAQYLGQANKCSRTFATLLDALSRQRGKTTTQRVIVENVTVEAGGQAVVGAVGERGRR